MDWNLKADSLVAFASMIVAVLALGVTVWQGLVTRRHNRLSVEPFLTWSVSRTFDEEGATFVFAIENRGIGPALTKACYFTVRGERFSNGTEGHDVVKALADAMLRPDVRYHLGHHGLPGRSSAISPGQDFVVAKLTFPNAGPEELAAVEKKLEDVNFVVDYETIYGELRRMESGH